MTLRALLLQLIELTPLFSNSRRRPSGDDALFAVLAAKAIRHLVDALDRPLPARISPVDIAAAILRQGGPVNEPFRSSAAHASRPDPAEDGRAKRQVAAALGL